MELAESKNAVQHEEEKQMLVSIQTLSSRFDAFRTIRPKKKATQIGYWICTDLVGVAVDVKDFAIVDIGWSASSLQKKLLPVHARKINRVGNFDQNHV